MKLLFLIAIVCILGVHGQGGPPEPPRDKFFNILRCIVSKYCRRETPECMDRMEKCAKRVLSIQKPNQDEMKNTFEACARENNIPFDEDPQPGQPPSHEHTDEQKCIIMECIMKKNKTFAPFVECVNRQSAQDPARAKRRH